MPGDDLLTHSRSKDNFVDVHGLIDLYITDDIQEDACEIQNLEKSFGKGRP